MCVVSMVGDHYADKWRGKPWITPIEPWRVPHPGWPFEDDAQDGKNDKTVPFVGVSKQEFDALKRDVEEMKALLKRAKEYDERNGEPDCEIDEKMDLLRRVAKLVGVNIDDVIGQKSQH